MAAYWRSWYNGKDDSTRKWKCPHGLSCGCSKLVFLFPWNAIRNSTPYIKTKFGSQVIFRFFINRSHGAINGIIWRLTFRWLSFSLIFDRVDFAELKVSDLEEIQLPSEPFFQTRPSTSQSQKSSMLSVPSTGHGKSSSSFSSVQKKTEAKKNKSSSSRDVTSAWSRSTSSIF